MSTKNSDIGMYIIDSDSQGILVEEAESGYEGLNMLRNSKAGYYDLILMDIQMPVMDGYLATREIRCISDPALASVPIVAMTANAFKEDQEKCMQVGMNGHLSKPINLDALTKIMSQIFRNS